MKKLGILLCFSILAACNNQKAEPEVNTYTIKGDTIILDDNSIIAPKLKIEQVQESAHQLEMISTGTVRAIPNFYAEIAPPFSGRVTKVFLKLGMKTKPGTPLFEMASPDFTEVQKSFFQARSELNSAKATLKRQEDLHSHGVAAQRDLEEAQTHYEMQQQEFANAAASLKIYGVNPNTLSMGQNLIVTSPIAGEVITNDVVMGHYIKEDDEPRAKIAQLNKVWVVGEVKEKDISFISDLDKAEISLPAYPDKNIPAEIYHIDEIVDEETRSIKVMMEVENKDQLLKPGMYVSVKFLDTSKDAILVPAKAVLQYNDRSFVFKEISSGRYIRQYVESGISVDDQIIITEGLQHNDNIITEGAFYLLDAK